MEGNRLMIELSDENAVTRRKAVELAAAVATFGVAMGTRPGSSVAQGKYEGK
jgi:Na+/glutamate symporter